MSTSLLGLLFVTSLVVLECTYGVLSQHVPDVDLAPSSWRTERRPALSEESLRNLAEYLALAHNSPSYLKKEEDVIAAIPKDALAPPKFQKRACFNVLDACCMFNIKCDRFSKKRFSPPLPSYVEKESNALVPVVEDGLSLPKPAKRACFNVLDACCMFNIKCDRFSKKRFRSQMH